MPDTSRMVPAIEGDRAGQPGVELRGDGIRHVDHVYWFNLWWEFFLSFSALLARFILVFAWCLFPFVFNDQTKTSQNPTFINKAFILYSQYPDCNLSFLLVLRLLAGKQTLVVRLIVLRRGQ